MKKIVLVLLVTLFYNQFSYSQIKVNLISNKEYEQIKINDIPLFDVIRTNGEYSKLKSMFGNDLQYKTYEKSFEVVEYWNNKIVARFEEDDKILTYVKLYYPSTLTIKGKRVKLGDDISELGLVIIDTTSSPGIYTIDYADKETYTASFTIEVNPNTKKITDIYYILF
jgi:hypothetical protein